MDNVTHDIRREAIDEAVFADLRAYARSYTQRHANTDGLTITPVPGLRMMCISHPGGDLHSIYRPLVCVVLQGAKRMVVGREEQVFTSGQSVIVAADMPVVGRIVQASIDAPYTAVAVDLDMSILRELAPRVPETVAAKRLQTLFFGQTEKGVLDCVRRLIGLIEMPETIDVLRPAILQELHFWLLVGPHGSHLRALADPSSHASRLGKAVSVLRRDFRRSLAVGDLAAVAGMSATAFHRHFKTMTALTPGKYQQRLRLIEARRLMLHEGLSATCAAFDVGYQSLSHFTRDYRRLFGAPPKQYIIGLSTKAGHGIPSHQA